MPSTTGLTVRLSWADGAPSPDLDEGDLRAALVALLAGLGYREGELGVLFADDARLRALNREQRGLDRPTDVLSWCYARPTDPAAGEAPAGPPGAPLLLGELALSLQRAAAQAVENGWALRTEVLRLLAHGCAHVAGYDHETEAEERVMKAAEVRLLDALGLPGLYPPDSAA